MNQPEMNIEIMQRRTKMMQAGMKKEDTIVFMSVQELEVMGWKPSDTPRQYLGCMIALERPMVIGTRQVTQQESMNFIGGTR